MFNVKYIMKTFSLQLLKHYAVICQFYDKTLCKNNKLVLLQDTIWLTKKKLVSYILASQQVLLEYGNNIWPG